MVYLKKVIFKKCVSLVLANALFLVGIVGCAGSAPNPVQRYQPGDEKRSCNALFAEFSSIDQEVVLKNKKKGQRDFLNVLWFIGGVFVIVPFFFIDAKGSYEVEVDALKARKTQLEILFAEKNCSPPASAVETK